MSLTSQHQRNVASFHWCSFAPDRQPTTLFAAEGGTHSYVSRNSIWMHWYCYTRLASRPLARSKVNCIINEDYWFILDQDHPWASSEFIGIIESAIVNIGSTSSQSTLSPAFSLSVSRPALSDLNCPARSFRQDLALAMLRHETTFVQISSYRNTIWNRSINSSWWAIFCRREVGRRG
jgi:hypothetical protein